MTVRSDAARPDHAPTIRIGVTGHRPVALADANISILRAQTHNVLTTLLGAVYGRPIGVVTSLAEGSDQLVAEEALAVGYTLRCPLPFTRDVYAQDFLGDGAAERFFNILSRASIVQELPGSRLSKEHEIAAYAAASQRVLREADLLLAIWNGESGRGEGGTFDVVTKAKERRLPVIWISSMCPHLVQVVFGGEATKFEASVVSKLIRSLASS